ncbi:hypothetical protein TGME49_222880 [Toxoplasma gondii ME49]|uniref:CS domain-containing protein n=1 Tax=Toxoplasma gondii (strain ATCC 50611 / Me49) TaxID=508771 RepID=S8FE88_TOXGM|nr:hypothetical protein TGME49_222880 [Toxoplasma gondii ME49]EPT32093.1 hypothetical protein TGME49_222880 [Toxoplasma gondii ME49]|eukprot:XP_018638324.1 hypothetical protein TGME49_222880 [Toxoplasma gondii ME49]
MPSSSICLSPFVVAAFFLLRWSLPLLDLNSSLYLVDAAPCVSEVAQGGIAKETGDCRVSTVSLPRASARLLPSRLADHGSKGFRSSRQLVRRGLAPQLARQRSCKVEKGDSRASTGETRKLAGVRCRGATLWTKQSGFLHSCSSGVPRLNAFLHRCLPEGPPSSVSMTHRLVRTPRCLSLVPPSFSLVPRGLESTSITPSAFLSSALSHAPPCFSCPRLSLPSFSLRGASPSACEAARPSLPLFSNCDSLLLSASALHRSPPLLHDFLVSRSLLVSRSAVVARSLPPRPLRTRAHAVPENRDSHEQLLEKFQQEFSRLQRLLPASLSPQEPGVSGASPANSKTEKSSASTSNREKERLGESGEKGSDGEVPTIQELRAEAQREGNFPKRDPKVLKELEEVIDGLYKDSDASNDNLFNRLTNLVKSGAFGERLQDVYEEQEKAQHEAEEAQKRREAEDGFNPHDVAKAVREAAADPAAMRVVKSIMSAGNAPAREDAGEKTDRPRADADSQGGDASQDTESERAVEDRRLRQAAEQFAEAPETAAARKNENDLLDIIRGSTRQYLEQLDIKPTPPGKTRLDDNTVIQWKEETDILQVWIPLPPNYIRESIDVSMARARLRVTCRVSAGNSQDQKAAQDNASVQEQKNEKITIVDRQMKGYIVSADAHWSLASYPFKRRSGNQVLYDCSTSPSHWTPLGIWRMRNCFTVTSPFFRACFPFAVQVCKPSQCT